VAQPFGKELLSRCGKQPVPLLEAVARIKQRG
jgi:hypothetical protein